MQKAKIFTKKGFSLIETLSAVFIFTLAMVMVSGTFTNFLKNYNNAKKMQRSVENAQYALGILAKTLRTSETNSTTFPLKTYDYSQGKCIQYSFVPVTGSFGKLVAATTVNPPTPTSLADCDFSSLGTPVDLTSGIIAIQGIKARATDPLASPPVIGEITLSLLVKDSGLSGNGIPIQTTISFRVSGSATVSGCSASTICGQYCTYNGQMYKTVRIGSTCWFAENLRTSRKPDGTALSLLSDYYCYTGDANCTQSSANADSNGAKYGALYTLTAALNGAAADGALHQGICPAGWFVNSPGTVAEANWLSGSSTPNGFNLPFSGGYNTMTGYTGRGTNVSLYTGVATGGFPVLDQYDGSGNTSNYTSTTATNNTAFPIRCSK